MSKKRQRRIQETNALYEESVHAQADGLGRRDDADLFVVDREGSKRARRKIQDEVLPKKEGTYLSASDKAVLKKIQQQQHGKQISPSSSSSVLPRHATGKVSSPLEDLWATESVPASAATSSTTAIVSVQAGGEGSRRTKQAVAAGNRKLKKPLPGQSYHPSQAAHQDVLAEALANELRRQAQEKDNEKVDLKAILADSRAVTHLFLNDSHDDSDDDEQEEDGDKEEEHSDSNRKEKVRPSKLTRAQRNRQQQLRSQAAHLVKKKREARLLASIDQVKQINRLIDQEEAKREQEHALRQLQASSSSSSTSGGSGAAVLDVNQVPLSDELHGSLRLVKAKGVPLRDAVQSLISSGQANSQQRLGRLKRAHPHKGKKIKWVAKYKYGQASER
eukprot:gene9020-9955_t